VIPAGKAPATRKCRSQAARTAETRSRLIDATIGCLIEIGYARTRTGGPSASARVFLMDPPYHFGTRERLLGAALDEIYAPLERPVVASLEELPSGESRVEGLVELMWIAFEAPELKAVVELWLAAANKPDVGWAVWPEAGAFDRAIHPLAE